MIAEKKKQAQTLGALVGLLLLVAAYTYWTNRTPATGTAAAPAGKKPGAAVPLSAANAQIRLDLVNGRLDQSAVGRRNVFQYYVPPPPPKPVPPPAGPVVSRPQAPQGPIIPPPPPPPQTLLTSFRFDFVGIEAKPGKLHASISDGTNRYMVTEGEFILGRYRINRITETNVEIEDMDLNRRQTYNRRTEA